jgi:hypothetical protein
MYQEIALIITLSGSWPWGQTGIPPVVSDASYPSIASKVTSSEVLGSFDALIAL